MNTNSVPGVVIVDCDGRPDETYPSAIYDCLDMADKYGWPPKFYFRDGSLNEELARTGVWNTGDAQSVKDDDARALAEALDRAIAAEPNFELVGVVRSLGEIARALDEALDRTDAAEPTVERVDVLRWLGEIARALVEAYDAAEFERVDLLRRLAEIARRGGFTVYWNQHEIGHPWRRSRDSSTGARLHAVVSSRIVFVEELEDHYIEIERGSGAVELIEIRRVKEA
jgi:hypothetical protein